MSRQRRFGLLAPLEERILGVMLLRPEQSWYRSELARELELPASSLQRPLAALAGAGVIRELHRKGNRIYYQADTEHPLFPELRSMIAKTSGLVDVLKEALKGVAPRIKAAFVYGSVASGAETSTSDVDLMVIGDAGLLELSLHLRQARRKLGREVNPTVYSEREFATKLRSRNRFLLGIMDKPKLFVVGIEDDLGRIAAGEAS